MKTVRLPSGERVPALGLGTWRMGEHAASRAQEMDVIRLALDLGITLIDTAEMYGEGRAEALIGEALEGRRDAAFLVTKFYPHNASAKRMTAACERSLTRLRTDRIELYLLHWRGDVPFEDTLEGLEELRESGKIRHYGVSNLDLADMKEWWALPGGAQIATDQVLYNLSRRGIEWGLLPWLRAHQVPIMAYSPIEQARLLSDPNLQSFAQRHGMTPAQAALAWLLGNDDVIAIPKTSHPERLREARGALDVTLTPAQRAELDGLFPPPTGPSALDML